ncbi:MAG: carboxypeptidase regulatory-like domain-containing protein, partial [Ginsengibacter sp.]
MLFRIFVFEKKHRFKFFLALTLLFSLGSKISVAQSKIKGKVIDGKGNGLANANVLLLNANDSSLVKGFVTSESGNYIFDTKRPGKYLITSTYTGYNQVYTPGFTISSNNENVEIGTITLSENNTQLNTVTVTVVKPLFEQKIDRLVINVKNSIIAAGSTVLDILDRSPGIIVDRQNNVISMNGKSGVVIMINGKINHMPFSAILQMLSGMSSANIEKIELITTPPANLDAEGNAGFINIVLLDDPSFGTNGSYSATIGYGRGATTMASINFNHRNGKINLNGDISFSRIEARQTFDFYRKVHFNSKITESNTI